MQLASAFYRNQQTYTGPVKDQWPSAKSVKYNKPMGFQPLPKTQMLSHSLTSSFHFFIRYMYLLFSVFVNSIHSFLSTYTCILSRQTPGISVHSMFFPIYIQHFFWLAELLTHPLFLSSLFVPVLTPTLD